MSGGIERADQKRKVLYHIRQEEIKKEGITLDGILAYLYWDGRMGTVTEEKAVKEAKKKIYKLFDRYFSA